MNDFRLPRPFMNPGAWPDPTRSLETPWVLSLELALTSGGPLRSYFHSIVENAKHVIWDIQSESLLNDLNQDPRLFEEAQNWLKSSKGPIRIQLEGERISRMIERLPLRAPYELIERESSFGVRDWFLEVTPEFVRRTTRQGLEIENYVSEYEKEFGRALEFPWHDLGYFAGFLRRRGNLDLAELFHYEWSRAQVFYSPQDEELEEKRLNDSEVILNPTIQILRQSSSRSSLIVLVRYSGQLIESEINPVQAALIDEVSEGFRAQVSEVLPNAEKTLQKMKHNTSALQTEFETLLGKRIFLKGTKN